MAQVVRVHNKHPNVYIINRTNARQFTRRAVNIDDDLKFIVKEIKRRRLSINEILELVLDVTDNKVYLSYSTIKNWLDGQTRRPQNHTLKHVALALGFSRDWQKVEKDVRN